VSVKSASLKSYILRRVLQSIPLIFAVIIFNFIIIHLAPSDPAVLLAGEFTTPEWLEKTRNYFGLTKPLHEQLTIYVFNVVRGDFGYSFYHMQPVMDVIIARVPVTLLLMVTQLVFASIAGILLGAISARKPYSFTDNASSAVALVGWSVPSFWLGMMFIMFFSLQLGWFPVQGVVTLREELDKSERDGATLARLYRYSTVEGLEREDHCVQACFEERFDPCDHGSKLHGRVDVRRGYTR